MTPRRKARLLNCLQTILDLESELRSIREARSVLGELTALRSIMRSLDLGEMVIDENDVQHALVATKAFLRELEVHFQNHDEKPRCNKPEGESRWSTPGEIPRAPEREPSRHRPVPFATAGIPCLLHLEPTAWP